PPMALTRDKLFWSAFTDHAAQTAEAAKLLVQMLEQLERRESIAERIKELEHRGDEITHDTLNALHHTWITPLDREEIHGLISSLDDVLELVEAASDCIALYEIRETRSEAIELAKSLLASVGEIQRAVSMLSDMKDAKPLLSLCVEINRHE